VLFRDEPGEARRLTRRAGVDWPLLVDGDEKVAHAYGIGSAPVTFVVRADGSIAGTLVGPFSRPLLERQLNRIL
jgi:peroxiredoxin